MAFDIIVFIFLLQTVRIAANATSTGYLITYNQYPAVLDTAPPCFINGCGSGPVDSMSTNCNSSASCYPLWSMLNTEYQQQNNWCSKAKGDTACRIPGWPVMNASAVCDASSQSSTWLFNGKTGCCSSQPVQLAIWMESMCNGSYLSLFSDYNDMAREDWEQYLLPWNWTVQALNSTGVVVSQPTCPKTPLYLGSFVIENLFFLLFIAFLTWAKLRWLQGEDHGEGWVQNVQKLAVLITPFTWTKDRIVNLFRIFFKGNGEGVDKAVTSAMLALFMASLQLVSNLISAYIIKSHPGYGHIPLPLLMLLFCARPRLAFLACLFSLLPNKWIIHLFKIRDPRRELRAQRTIAEIALSSAASEIIMQGLASYSLGRAAHVGAQKRFYYVGHLWPYWRGKDARILYLGALFWLIACVVILVVWGAVFIFQVSFLNATDKLSDWYKDWQERRREAISRSRQRERTSSDDTDRPEQNFTESGNLLVQDQGGNLRRTDGLAPPGRRYYGRGKDPEQDQNLRRYDTGAGVNSVPGPIQQDEFNMRADVMPIAGSRLRNQTAMDTSRSRMAELEVQNLRPDVLARTSASRPSTSAVRRTAYNRVPSDTVDPTVTQMRADLLTPPRIVVHPMGEQGSNNTSSTLIDSGTEAWDSITEVPGTPRDSPRNIRSAPSRDPFSDTAYYGVNGDPEDEDHHSEKSPPYDRGRHFSRDIDEVQPWLLLLGFIIGLVAYVAQWLFWAGFVNASGERYAISRSTFSCPS